MRSAAPTSRCRSTTTSSTRARRSRPAARCASRPPTSAIRSSAPSSARRPAGSASTGTSPTQPAGDAALRPRGWAGENWSPAIGAEALATRRAAGLFDESSFSKLEVLGSGACAFLERICANRIDKPVGSVVYTQMLNPRGGIECDLSVIRRAPDRFLLVTGTAFGVHDRRWIEGQAPRDGTVYVSDVTSAFACFGLWGPRARDILQPLTKTSLGGEDFRYLTAQEVSVGDVPCLAVRVTYVGELGWELYCPTEYGLRLWDTLWEAGREHGLVAAGYRAIDALRLEKGYRAWATDLTPERTPDEAGVGFAVKLDKGEFVGRDALAASRDNGGAPERLVSLVLEDPRAIALGSEPVRLVGGDVVGRVTSGGFGYTTECEHRARLRAVGAGRAGHACRGGHLRGLDRRRDPGRPALRSGRRAGSRVTERRSTR